MLDLFGDELKTKRITKSRAKPIPAFAASTERARRYPAIVRGARVETVCAHVSPACWVWVVVGPTKHESQAAMRAYRRLKAAGYQHVLAVVPPEKQRDARDQDDQGKNRAAGPGRAPGKQGRRGRKDESGVPAVGGGDGAG